MPDSIVSVITCFLNGEAWIAEAIESVLRQTYAAWELILVDDGSSDGATQIARRYAGMNPGQIRYVEHPRHINRGLTASRNTGASVASGRFLAFLDADDVWSADKLLEDLRLFNRNPAVAMICHASTFWYRWENPSYEDRYTAIGAPAEQIYPPGTLNILVYPLGTGAPPCPSGIIVRREAFERQSGFEEAFKGIYGLYEDQAFLAKMYLNETVYISGRADNLYRKHSGSMTDSLNDFNLYSTVRMFFLRWLITYLDRAAVFSSPIRQLVENRLAELEEAVRTIPIRE